ncbi:hypothetical protein DPMN_132206 [Dreissena polymorpha]|uniref:Uncharacterized protein n=1 Tax=Dreissena polymorpha TaxID=45954 RepID=A0A9D4FR51_DREPO|nr:hypothetical protein DPMN_132206 [Dreissena polymorpha]
MGSCAVTANASGTYSSFCYPKFWLHEVRDRVSCTMEMPESRDDDCRWFMCCDCKYPITDSCSSDSRVF